MRQLTVADVKRRTGRLAELERGLAREIGLQRDDELLLFRERRQYLRAVQDALAGAEAARVVLQAAPLGARLYAAVRSCPTGALAD
jgi:hypothetical protein